MTQNAVIRELEVLGEAAAWSSPEFVAAHPEAPWREIIGMRHKLIHDYFIVDLGIVWSTATVNVPAVEVRPSPDPARPREVDEGTISDRSNLRSPPMV